MKNERECCRKSGIPTKSKKHQPRGTAPKRFKAPTDQRCSVSAAGRYRRRRRAGSMKITLGVFLALLTIYCNSTALSVPPSLITGAASLSTSQLSDHHQPPKERSVLWNKDAQEFPVAARDPTPRTADRAQNVFDDISRLIRSNIEGEDANANERNRIHTAASALSATAQARPARQWQHLYPTYAVDMKRKLPDEYDLNALLAARKADGTVKQSAGNAAAEANLLPQEMLPPQIRTMKSSELFTPLKYWARHCQPDNNCPQEYYRALFASRKNAADTVAQRVADHSAANNINAADIGAAAAVGEDGADINLNEFAAIDDNTNAAPAKQQHNDYDDDDIEAINNDILMLLHGEQDVVKFLNWAMAQLYPYQKFENFSENGAEYYHPGMYIWKKLNLSGRLEPPLMVEEPHYIIVRREQLQEDLQKGSQYKDDPFIPPRGRKHNLPDLDALLQRYETFVPNRGRRDKIKDIFKYDDLFYPNRGKKQKPPKATTLALLDNGDCEVQRGGGGQAAGSEQESVIGSDTSVATAAEDSDDEKTAYEGSHLAAPPSTVAMRRMLGKLKRRLIKQQKRCLPHTADGAGVYNNQQALEVATREADEENRQGDTSGSSSHSRSRNKSTEELPERMAEYTKSNEYDQSAMPSMPTGEPATSDEGASGKAAPQATKNSLQQQWHATAFSNTRLRRIAGTFAGAARVAANRLHATRSMSAMAQRQRQQLLQQQHHQRRYQRREQQPPALRTLQQHRVKSQHDLDLLLGRQLQLLQHKPLTMRNAPQQPFELRQQPLETQLADVAADDDIDYFYSSI